MILRGRRSPRWLAALVVGFGLVASLSPASAQQADDADLLPLEILGVMTRDDNQIQVELSAPDGLTGTELPASAFRVAQEGVDRPVSVQRLPDDELDIVLAIDVSGSMVGAPMDSAKEAATAFLRQLPPGARIALVAFGPTVDVVVPFSTDLQQIADAVNGLQPDGSTALHDAVIVSVDQFPLARTSRRTIVLLGDGLDTVSTSTLEEASARVTAGGIDLYAISLGEANLEPLARLVDAAGGGQVANAGDPSALVEVYRSIGEQLANQYRLIFTPADSVSSSARVFVDQLGISAVGSFTFDPVRSERSAAAESAPAIAAVDATVAAPVFSTVEAGWASTDQARLVGVGLSTGALLLIGGFLFSTAPRAVGLASDRARNASPSDSLGQARDRATGVAATLLERRDRGRILGLALDRAGLALRPAEFVVVVFTIAVVVAAMLALLGGILVALLGTIAVVVGARSWVSFRAARRSEQFTEQLGQTVQLLAGSLRAGHALPQALETVAKESEPPTGDEFHRLVTELRLGRDLDHSLQAMADRVGSEDFEWVVRAIAIHREVGGDLAEVLDNIGTTIRDRSYIRRQFKALSAEGRYSAYLLVALPFIVVLALLVISPEYVEVLFTDRRGKFLVAGAGVNLLIGSLWLKALLRVRF